MPRKILMPLCAMAAVMCLGNVTVAAEPPQPSKFAALMGTQTKLIVDDDYDVFGDGTVVIKAPADRRPGPGADREIP